MPRARRSQSRRPLGQQGGFTLLELLIAITLLSVITLIISGALRFSGQVVGASDRSIEHSREVHAIHDLLRLLLSRAYPLPAEVETTTPVIAFEGTRTELRFVATVPEIFGDGALHRVAIFLDAGPLGRRLAMSWDPVFDDWSERVASYDQSTTLLANVERLSIDYYGVPERGRSSLWADAWRDRSSLPDLIRVAVKLTDDAKHAWPPLVVEPRIDVDSGCVFDTVSSGCRRR